MKFYTIHRIRDTKNGPIYDLPRFFAFTDDKKAIEDFKGQRNMSMFYISEKKISKEGYDELEFNKNRDLLVYRGLYTKDEDGDKTTISVLTTWNEIELLYKCNDNIMHELAKHVTSHVYTLKPEYIDTFMKLGYGDAIRYEWGSRDKYRPEFDGIIDKYGLDLPFGETDIQLDEFKLYMYFYRNTYK